jgi:hypothetical protein
MFCNAWDHLYEQYESAALKRIEKKRGTGFAFNATQLEHLNVKIADALRKLREHEKQHGCH